MGSVFSTSSGQHVLVCSPQLQQNTEVTQLGLVSTCGISSVQVSFLSSESKFLQTCLGSRALLTPLHGCTNIGSDTEKVLFINSSWIIKFKPPAFQWNTLQGSASAQKACHKPSTYVLVPVFTKWLEHEYCSVSVLAHPTSFSYI